MIYPTLSAHGADRADELAAQGRPPGMTARPYMLENQTEVAAADPAEPFSAEFLRNVEDPAGFIESRLRALDAPTPAVVRSAAGGEPQPLNPAHLATPEQAQAMLARLQQLGLPVEEVTGGSYPPGPFAVDYGDDPRRSFEIAGMNVGALLRLYAACPKEVAEQMIVDEWRRLNSA
jgi:hypothetical protein